MNMWLQIATLAGILLGQTIYLQLQFNHLRRRMYLDVIELILIRQRREEAEVEEEEEVEDTGRHAALRLVRNDDDDLA